MLGGKLRKNSRALSSAGRAPDLHSGGQRFDPVRVHKNLLYIENWNGNIEIMFQM
jgi:hypothetical protein